MPGVFAMSITPFNHDGALDEVALREHLQFLAARSVGVYLASTGTGEGKSLSRDEVRRVYTIGVKTLKGKMPVYAAGMGLTDTRTVVERCNDALACGVDAVYLYGPRPGPEANKPSIQEMRTFFDDVLGAIDGPAWIANNTTVTAYELPHDLIADLFKKYGDKIVGIGNAHQDIHYTAGLVEVAGKKPVYVAMLPHLPGALALGARGTLAPDPNVIPTLCRLAYEGFCDGDSATAMKHFSRILRLGVTMSKYRNPRAQKAALNIMGLPGGYPRRPYLPLDEAAHKDIARALDSLDIRRIEGIG